MSGAAKPASRRRTMKVEPLEPRMVLAANVVISEFMASNSTTLADEDGDFPDWLELYNAGSTAADLNGWFLTDDANELDKWRVPEVTLDPGRFLVVFASNKDRINPQSFLHTNFALRSGGEYLALVEPDGRSVAFQYAPQYPPQLTDVSFGLPQEFTTLEVLPSRSAAAGWVPADDSLASDWLQTDFDDSTWIQGTTGIGFERAAGYENLIGLDVGDQMWGQNGTSYLRVPFDVADAGALSSLTLRMKYDDGFVAYINGDEVWRENAPTDPTWNSSATSSHSDSLAVQFEDFDISDHLGSLRTGENVLAIQGLNAGAANSDFLVLPELTSRVRGEIQTDVHHFLFEPTPGDFNGLGSPAAAQPVEFSVTGGIFTEAFSLTLTTPTPDAVIIYTLDGSEPNARSRVFDRPLDISQSTTIRAKAVAPGLVASRTASESYVLMDNAVAQFSSDLPVIVLENFNGQRPPTEGFQAMAMSIFEQVDGRTVLTSDPTLSTRGGIRRRGSSTVDREKASYAIEAWDANNNDADISPLGMPADSDWILYAAYNFDRALMRNPLIYDLSNQVGRYAVRTRFVEVYFNQNGGPVSQADYVGVYSLMEKIKRGPDRVDIQELTPGDIAEPEISGGYILKIDRPDPFDSGFSAAGQTIRYVDPKEDDIEQVPAQQAWIRNYFNEFRAVLDGPNFADPDIGYAKYIDVDSWIDHHILNVLPMNVDAFRLSGYFYKDRGGKIEMGPIWDFDRSMGSTDGRDSNPLAWNGTGDATRFFDYPWWDRLFQDPNFWQKWIDRWTELRGTVLSTENIHATIDRMAETLGEAQVRNFDRWTAVRPRFGGYQGEIDHLKQWLADRAEWIDRQFLSTPILGHPGGSVEPGFQLDVMSEHTLYYTLDGADPRLPGGGLSPNAILAETSVDVTTLLPSGAAASVFVPSDDSLGSDWTQLGFDDSAWSSGVTGVGYDRDTDFEAVIGLDVEDAMYRVNSSAYIRIPFQVDDPSALDSLLLKMKFDDGFVAYINGTRVASANDPVGLAWNSEATRNQSDAAALLFREFPISEHLPLLEPGENVLAIQGLNSNSADADFLILPELSNNDIPTAVITINESAQFKARARRRGDWSGLVTASFLVGGPPELRITEIMFHPQDPPAGSPYNDDDFEFIELQNTGDTPLSLGGIRFADGIEFTFPDMDLAPGGVVVVVSNQAAFETRYGIVDNLVGQYTGRLSNSGEHLLLEGAVAETILDFTYRDNWYPTTDGDGHSLVIRNAAAAANTWGLATSWRASDAPGGNPGVADPPPLPGDANGDGRVDLDDLNMVRNNFGTAGPGDVNGDGMVDSDDLNLVRGNFGRTTPVAATIANVAQASPDEAVEPFAIGPVARAPEQPAGRVLRGASRRAAVGADVESAVDRAFSEIRFDRARSAARGLSQRASRGHVVKHDKLWDEALLAVFEDGFRTR